jgi:prepilin-type processing-associated H-X9-DG protein
MFGSKYAPANEWAATRHQGHANYVFFDGSAKSYPAEAFLIPKSGHPCSRQVAEWIGPASGPTFNPDGAS